MYGFFIKNKVGDNINILTVVINICPRCGRNKTFTAALIPIIDKFKFDLCTICLKELN